MTTKAEVAVVEIRRLCAHTDASVPLTAFRMISTESLLIQYISVAREFSAHKHKR